MRYLKEFIDFSDIEEYDNIDDIKGLVVYDVDTGIKLFLNQQKKTPLHPGWNYNYYYEYSIMIESNDEWKIFVDKINDISVWNIRWLSGNKLDYDDIKSLGEKFDFDVDKTPIKIFLVKREDRENYRYIFFREIDDKELVNDKIIKLIYK
jgi:hypothetical protein